MKLSRNLFALLGALVFGGCSAGADLERLCAIASEAANEDLEDPERAYQVAARWERDLRHPEVRQMIAAIASASADQKYALLRAGAAELGHPEWECEALSELFEPAHDPSR